MIGARTDTVNKIAATLGTMANNTTANVHKGFKSDMLLPPVWTGANDAVPFAENTSNIRNWTQVEYGQAGIDVLIGAIL